jgi:hypothetical protein
MAATQAHMQGMASNQRGTIYIPTNKALALALAEVCQPIACTAVIAARGRANRLRQTYYVSIVLLSKDLSQEMQQPCLVLLMPCASATHSGAML